MLGDTADDIIEAITEIEERILAICDGSLPPMFRRPNQSGEEAMWEEIISPLGDISYNLALMRDEGDIE